MAPWLEIAEQYLGQHEIPGPQANQFIINCLFDHTDVDRGMAQSDETAWCSAFACRCMEEAGIPSPHSAWARSWLDWGREPTEEEFNGAVCILSRGENSGHVGFLVDYDDNRVCLLGGNQGDRVCKAWFPASRVLGYRVPA